MRKPSGKPPTPHATFTIPQEVQDTLEELAAQDAAATGRPQSRSATLCALVIAEKKRRDRAAEKKTT